METTVDPGISFGQLAVSALGACERRIPYDFLMRMSPASYRFQMIDLLRQARGGNHEKYFAFFDGGE